MGKGKCCSTSAFMISWLVISLLLREPLPAGVPSGVSCSSLEVQNVPQAVQSRQAGTPSSPSPRALSQLSQLLLTLINFIRISDQVVCRKWEAKHLPQAPSAQPSRGCHAECCRCCAAKGMSFLLPQLLPFPAPAHPGCAWQID